MNARRLMVMTMGLLTLISGCSRSWKGGTQWGWEEKIKRFDKYHREFGEIAVSRPIVSANNRFFSLSFNKTAAQLYDEVGHAQVVGKIGSFNVNSTKISAAVEAGAPRADSAKKQITDGVIQDVLDNAKVNPTPKNQQTAMAAVGMMTPEMPAAANPMEPATPQPLAVPPLPDNPASKRLGELTGAAGVLGPLPGVSASPFAKATEAANAHYLIKLLELYSDPSRFKINSDKEVLVIATTITVSPGSVTRKHFLAEVTMRMHIIDKSKEEGDNDRRVHVPIVSVFPSTVGQNMDLQSMVALQRDFAAQLQAGGMGAAANALFSNSSAFQSNTRSLNQRVSISAFNRVSTGHCGWRIRGEYWAYNPDNPGAVSPDLFYTWTGVRLEDILPVEPTFGAGSAVFMQDVTIPVVVMAIVPKSVSEQASKLVKHVKQQCGIICDHSLKEIDIIRNLRKRLTQPQVSTKAEVSKQISNLRDLEAERSETLVEELQRFDPKNKDGFYWKLHNWNKEDKGYIAKRSDALQDFLKSLDKTKSNQISKSEQTRLNGLLNDDLISALSQCAKAADADDKEARDILRFDMATRWLPTDRIGLKKFRWCNEFRFVEGLYRAEVAASLETQMAEDFEFMEDREKVLNDLDIQTMVWSDKDIRQGILKNLLADKDKMKDILEPLLKDKKKRKVILEPLLAGMDKRHGILKYLLDDDNNRNDILELLLADKDKMEDILEPLLADKDKRKGILEPLLADEDKMNAILKDLLIGKDKRKAILNDLLADKDSYKRFIGAWGDSSWRSLIAPAISAFQIHADLPEKPKKPIILTVYRSPTNIKGRTPPEPEDLSPYRPTILVVEGEHFGESPRFICAGLEAQTVGVSHYKIPDPKNKDKQVDRDVAIISVNPAAIKKDEKLDGYIIVVTYGGYSRFNEKISFLEKKLGDPTTTITVEENKDGKTEIKVQDKHGGANAQGLEALHHCDDPYCHICHPFLTGHTHPYGSGAHVPATQPAGPKGKTNNSPGAKSKAGEHN